MGTCMQDRLMFSQWQEGQHAWRMMNKRRAAPDGFRERSRGQLRGTLWTTVTRTSFTPGGVIGRETFFKGVTYCFKDITLASTWWEQDQKPQPWEGQALLWWGEGLDGDEWQGEGILHALGENRQGLLLRKIEEREIGWSNKTDGGVMSWGREDKKRNRVGCGGQNVTAPFSSDLRSVCTSRHQMSKLRPKRSSSGLDCRLCMSSEPAVSRSVLSDSSLPQGL